MATAAPLVTPLDTGPEPLWQPDRRGYRRNVRCLFSATLFSFLVTAVSLGPLFDAYLLDLGGKSGNMLVGSVESFRGILQLAFAYPLGALSDRASRSGSSRVWLVRRSLPFWTVGLAVLVAAVLTDQVWLLFVGMALWAPSMTCWTSSASVMVAEHVDPPERTKILANLTSWQLLASSAGPLLQVGLLQGLRENRWDNDLLRWVISSGCVLWPGLVASVLAMKQLEPLEKAAGGGRGASSGFEEEALERAVCGVKVRWWVAITLEAATVTTAIGAGMTVKYFPLFFRTDYHFSPIAICVMNFGLPVGISVMVQICAALSRRLGRLRSVVLFHFLGTSCLWLMSYCRSLYVVLPIFFIRGALMNARGPIIRSMVLDCVTSEVRGRWNSIQSVSRFSWSGSAALGGYVADLAGDYRFTFVVTAGVYTFSLLITLPLLLVCPPDSSQAAPPRAAPAPSQQDGVEPAAASRPAPTWTAAEVLAPSTPPACSPAPRLRRQWQGALGAPSAEGGAKLLEGGSQSSPEASLGG